MKPKRPATGRWFGPVEPRQDPDQVKEADQARDNGRAIIEVVFLAVLLLIPVLYLLISVLRLQAATFAVTQAARDAGRAIDAAPSIDVGIDRAQQIAAIDLADQHVNTPEITLHFVVVGTSCTSGTPTQPTLDAGAVFDLCVTAVVSLPGVPTAVLGTRNTVTGVYTVHIGDLREGP